MSSLADQAKTGDPEALRKLVCEHYAQVFRFCARRVGPQAAADLTQEVFLTMQQSIKRFEERSSFSTWLLGIANNHCRTFSRTKKTEWLSLDNWFEPSATFESRVIDREFVNAALSKLSAEHREVVVLHELDGLSYPEISQLLGVPQGTVKSRLHHAFQNLRKSCVHPGASA
ncbi:MAG: RNA polymerase sigma factor [Armatimonadetes bacterium]|nr:RNA polymerase sigma factor [Armatimonadota bacterium]MBS1712411.1 RNA polymerase sigma factor [Armatimonadota bacterium]MBX3109280.1 RNA polymerase sigma factor [Fimbriimonadaceae bacterium]